MKLRRISVYFRFFARVLRAEILLTFLFLLSLASPVQNSIVKPTLAADTQVLPIRSQAKSIISMAQSNADLPIRLKIPKINVDAAVEQVGLTSSGAMAVPKDFSNVGWFDLGPRPGEKGSAVIAGHTGWVDGKALIFNNLNKLQSGDLLNIEGGTGATFVVVGSREYGPNEDASTVFKSNDGKAHLNLITCDGVWNTVSQSYSGRLVIFADKK